jgi:hypothetical protein
MMGFTGASSECESARTLKGARDSFPESGLGTVTQASHAFACVMQHSTRESHMIGNLSLGISHGIMRPGGGWQPL